MINNVLEIKIVCIGNTNFNISSDIENNINRNTINIISEIVLYHPPPLLCFFGSSSSANSMLSICCSVGDIGVESVGKSEIKSKFLICFIFIV